MKNATGISRWTSENRNHAIHILNEQEDELLCKKRFFSHNTEVFDIRTVTCAKCLSVYKRLHKESSTKHLV